MLEEYKDVLKIEDLMNILRVGKNKAYDMLRCGTIPNRKIGREYVIPKIGVINYLTDISKIA